MPISSIRAAVKALLRATSGVGEVNDLDPFNVEPDDFMAAFVIPATGEVNGWSIGIREVQPAQRLGIIEHGYEIRLRGLIGFQQDERSRADADAVVEAVVTKFGGTAANRRLPLSGTPTVDWTEPPRVDQVDRRVRSGEGAILCHDITVTITAVKEAALV